MVRTLVERKKKKGFYTEVDIPMVLRRRKRFTARQITNVARPGGFSSILKVLNVHRISEKAS